MPALNRVQLIGHQTDRYEDKGEQKYYTKVSTQLHPWACVLK